MLRAKINLGNPVLAHSHSSKEKPAGLTIDLARRLGGLLQLPVLRQAHDSGFLAESFRLHGIKGATLLPHAAP